MSEFSVDFDSSDDNSNSYHHRIAAKWFEISLTSLIFYVIYVIGLWKVFEKANEPGFDMRFDSFFEQNVFRLGSTHPNLQLNGRNQDCRSTVLVGITLSYTNIRRKH